MVLKYSDSVAEQLCWLHNNAYSVDQFCRLHNFGKTTLYKLLSEGRGPKVMKVGRRTLISTEEAEIWRKSLSDTFKSKPVAVDIESEEIV